MRLRPSSFAVVLALSAVAAACGRGSAAPPKTASTAVSAGAKETRSGVATFDAAAIDAVLRDAWKAAGVVPAARADDATFLRRVYVDVVGTVPTPDAVTKFVADPAPDKRAKVVEALLASPEYARHWMKYWDDVLMGRENRGNQVDRIAFRYWLEARFEASSPWDRMVRDLVSATGQNSVGGPKVKGPALAVPLGTKLDDEDIEELRKVNGAVNWTLRFVDAPQDLAGNASRVFLGVQIQCAQCHDHKTEKWKQDDFRRFANAFLHARLEQLDGGKAMGNVRRLELHDAPRIAPRYVKNADIAPIASVKARALDGTDLDKGVGTRKALAEWMTSKDNPWFAKAFVNRMWGHFVGRGFYDPVDDMRASNQPVMPELLDEIAADFVAHDFDIKHLIRTITATEAYQLAAAKDADPKSADTENKLWGRFHLVPLGPEELLNALFRVTNIEAAAEKAGVRNLDQLRMQLVRQYAFLFEVDETDDVPDYSGTVSQALVLLNGALVAQGSRALPSTALGDILTMKGGDADRIDALALRVLSRKPTEAERTRWSAYVQNATSPAPAAARKAAGPLGRLDKKAKSDPKSAAYEDILWAMLNSSEFVFNH